MSDIRQFPQTESGKLRTTAHRLDKTRENIAILTKSINQVESDIAIDSAMDKTYRELGLSEDAIESIKRDFWRNNDRIFKRNP